MFFPQFQAGIYLDFPVLTQHRWFLPSPPQPEGRQGPGKLTFLLQDIVWLGVQLGFGGKNSSSFVFLLLFISVLGIGTSWRQEMPLLES